MEEEWRPVVGCEGFYEVSNLGRVRGRTGQVMKPGRAGIGYLKIMISIEGSPVWGYYVHRMVLDAFVGPAPNMYALHGNHDKTDNRLSNLRWGTPSENTQEMVEAGRHSEQQKTHCPQGHPLKDPNLVASEKRSGTRKCRACNIARARMQRNKNITIQEASDLAFQQIKRGEV